MSVPIPVSTSRRRVASEKPFFAGLIFLAGFYACLVLALIGANFKFSLFKTGFFTWQYFRDALQDPSIQHSIVLTLVTCCISAILSVIVAVPTGYLLSRFNFPGRRWIDSLLDIPIVLPPLVIGISLLILFNNLQVPFVGGTLE